MDGNYAMKDADSVNSLKRWQGKKQQKHKKGCFETIIKIFSKVVVIKTLNYNFELKVSTISGSNAMTNGEC